VASGYHFAQSKRAHHLTLRNACCFQLRIRLLKAGILSGTEGRYYVAFSKARMMSIKQLSAFKIF
jgi:hypothetical protein